MINLGDVVAYVGLIALFDFPVFTSLFAYSQVASGLSSARRILELVRARSDLDQNDLGHASAMRGAIEFADVSFHYNPEQAGPEETARWPPLAGKRLLSPRTGPDAGAGGPDRVGQEHRGQAHQPHLRPQQGAVRVDGVDVGDWNLEVLRRQISIIEQDIFLFSRSIAENIAFGKPDATPEEIEAAARGAQAHDFIMSFPDGYRTVVGERGMMLSGGQRQRIALARAFLTDPAILILDDSTSAIDSATEDQIQRAIEQASRGRTTILITHRLSQIRWADRIVVLRQGRVAAEGTHEELLATSQPYRDIFVRM